MKELSKFEKLQLSFVNSCIDSLNKKLNGTYSNRHIYDFNPEKVYNILSSDIDYNFFTYSEDFQDISDFMKKKNLDLDMNVATINDQVVFDFFKNNKNQVICCFNGYEILELKKILENIKNEISTGIVKIKKIKKPIFVRVGDNLTFDGATVKISADSDAGILLKTLTEKYGSIIYFDELWEEFSKNDSVKQENSKIYKKKIDDSIRYLNKKASELYFNGEFIRFGSGEYRLIQKIKISE